MFYFVGRENECQLERKSVFFHSMCGKIQSTPNWQYFEMFMDSNFPLENLSKVPQCFRNIATLLKMNFLYIATDWMSDQQVEGLLGQSIRRTHSQLLSIVALDP